MVCFLSSFLPSAFDSYTPTSSVILPKTHWVLSGFRDHHPPFLLLARNVAPPPFAMAVSPIPQGPVLIVPLQGVSTTHFTMLAFPVTHPGRGQTPIVVFCCLQLITAWLLYRKRSAREWELRLICCLFPITGTQQVWNTNFGNKLTMITALFGLCLTSTTGDNTFLVYWSVFFLLTKHSFFLLSVGVLLSSA